jgi:hypothetical protein
LAISATAARSARCSSVSAKSTPTSSSFISDLNVCADDRSLLAALNETP